MSDVSSNETEREAPFNMDILSDGEIEQLAEKLIGNRYYDTRREKTFTVAEVSETESTVDGHRVISTSVQLDWDDGGLGTQSLDDFQTMLSADLYDEVET